MSNYVMEAEKEKETCCSQQMDLRKEYLGKLRIWNPIKLYISTNPLGCLHAPQVQILQFEHYYTRLS